MQKRTSHLGLTQKILLSVGALGVGGAIAGLGTFATFTSSTSASEQAATGTVTVGLGATGASTNRLSVAAGGVAPGDTVQRSVDLVNQGSLDLTSVSLTTTAAPSSLLDTDATNGLQMVVDRCSAPWTEAGTSPAFTYTCSGTTATVVASRPVIGANVALSNLAATTHGATDHLRVTLTLPTSAGNTFQNQTSTVAYNFTGTQRAAGNQ